ncbi:MAG: hypothetical protein ACRDJM_01365 [Actinomycetota bacterium]
MTDERVSTSYLGQFTEEHAEAIGKELTAAGMVWWHKASGKIMRFISVGDWGVRLFVDAKRLDEARAIARRVVAPGGS